MRVAGLGVLVCLAVVCGSVCATGHELRGRASAKSRPEPDAVIWIDVPHVDARRTERAVLTQRNLTFLPKSLAVQTGTTLEFPNEDLVFHNVFSFHDGQRFDLGTYPVGTKRRVVFSEAGVSRLFCNIHPHMAGYIVAVDSPLFSTTDQHGQFVIQNVPPGEYTYHAWRPSGRAVTGTIAIPAARPLEVVWP